MPRVISARERRARSETAKRRWAEGKLKGVSPSLETRAKIAASVSASTKGKPKPGNRGRTLSTQQKQQIAAYVASHSGQGWHSPEARAKANATRERRYRERRPSSLEVLVNEILIELGVSFKWGVVIAPYSVDFLIGDLGVLEVDGTYWHSLPGSVSRDTRKDAFLHRRGYKVYCLPEIRLREEPIATVLEAVCQLS